MEMEKFLNKKYEIDRSENMDEMLRELGINAMIRKLTMTSKTTVQLIKKSDDTYCLNTIIPLFSFAQDFKLGEEQDITTADGRKVKISFSIDGNRLIEKQIGNKSLIIEREYYDDQVIGTSTVGSAHTTTVCKTWSKLVE